MRKQSIIERGTAAAALMLLAIVSGPTALAQERAASARCDGCLGLEQCTHRLATCQSECRARIFAVDPRRNVCLKECSESVPACGQITGPPAQIEPSRAVSVQRR